MTYRHLTDLADACRKSGLRVVEVSGWRTFGRPASTGGFNPRGVLCHHTGSKDTNPESIADDKAYAEWLAKLGRSDLPAPLCQVSLGHGCVVYVCAAGRGNHAGEAKASGPMPAGDGNALYLGIEAQNSGTEGWRSEGKDAAGNTITQGEAYARLCAALCAHYGWPASHVRAHRETSVTGKWDPGRLDMDKHRERVADLMNGDDMPTAEEIAKAVLKTKLSNGGYVSWNVADTHERLERVERALAAMAAGISPTVEAAVKDALAEAIVSVDVNVNGAEK